VSGMYALKKKKCLLDYVQSTARYAVHLQFGISANTFEIRVVKSPKYCNI
jgi:hypothetical protein